MRCENSGVVRELVHRVHETCPILGSGDPGSGHRLHTWWQVSHCAVSGPWSVAARPIRPWPSLHLPRHRHRQRPSARQPPSNRVAPRLSDGASPGQPACSPIDLAPGKRARIRAGKRYGVLERYQGAVLRQAVWLPDVTVSQSGRRGGTTAPSTAVQPGRGTPRAPVRTARAAHGTRLLVAGSRPRR